MGENGNDCRMQGILSTGYHGPVPKEPCRYEPRLVGLWQALAGGSPDWHAQACLSAQDAWLGGVLSIRATWGCGCVLQALWSLDDPSKVECLSLDYWPEPDLWDIPDIDATDLLTTRTVAGGIDLPWHHDEVLASFGKRDQRVKLHPAGDGSWSVPNAIWEQALTAVPPKPFMVPIGRHNHRS